MGIKFFFISLIVMLTIMLNTGCSDGSSNVDSDLYKPSIIDKPSAEQSIKTYDNTLYQVERVVDGDTLIVKIGKTKERVRLIGVNTPESVKPNSPVEKYGKEASDFTKNLLKGEKVRLEYDVEKRDKYSRLLAYVYLPDGKMVNKILLKEGYAQVMTIPPNVKYQKVFLQIQKEAREQQKGLWKEN